MKHHHILFGALSALLCLGLSACGKNPVPQPPPAPSGSASAPQAVYDDSLITQLYSGEGAFTDEFGQKWDYSYHIPQLKDDRADAKAINREIAEYFGDDVRAALEGGSTSGMPQTYYADISWQSHWSGSLLSLSLSLLGWDGEGTGHRVYHYDFSSGTRLTNAQVLDRFGVEQAEFLQALRQASVQKFDSVYAPWGVPGLSPDDEDFGALCIELAALRAWTAAEENFRLDAAIFFPNGDGTFTAFQPVGSAAGASWYYEEMTVAPGPNEWTGDSAPQSDYAFVTAQLTGDGPSVRFVKGRYDFWDSELYRQSFGFAYDRNYPIAGCCGDYQTIFVGVCGQDLYPYVFLLTQGNTVEYADIFGGIAGGLLCSGGPLYGLRDIVGFENGVCQDEYGGGYTTVYAVDKNGEKYDLAPRIVMTGNSMPSSAAGSWRAEVTHRVDGGSYTDAYELSFHKNGFTGIENVIEGADIATEYGGYCTYLGTTEQGMIYRFLLYCGDEENQGAFALDFYNTRGDTLVVTPISGVNLFDAPQGSGTVFTRVFDANLS